MCHGQRMPTRPKQDGLGTIHHYGELLVLDGQSQHRCGVLRSRMEEDRVVKIHHIILKQLDMSKPTENDDKWREKLK